MRKTNKDAVAWVIVVFILIATASLFLVSTLPVSTSVTMNLTNVTDVEFCYLRVERVFGSGKRGFDMPIRVDQCDQLRYMCGETNLNTWNILGCEIIGLSENDTVCTCRLGQYDHEMPMPRFEDSVSL